MSKESRTISIFMLAGMALSCLFAGLRIVGDHNSPPHPPEPEDDQEPEKPEGNPTLWDQ